MAKRFTDSEKWEHPWFNSLPMEFKLLWLFILDKCDGAGVWRVNLDLAGYHLGAEFDLEEVKHYFSDRLLWLRDDKVWIKSFPQFQYSNLSPKNNAHRGIAKKLIQELDRLPLDEDSADFIHDLKSRFNWDSSDTQVRVIRASNEGQPTLQEKVKEKVKVKEEVKEKEEGDARGNKFQLPPSSLVAERKTLAEESEQLEQCYQAWLDTLAFYKAARPRISPSEQVEIVRAVQRQGSAKIVLYALVGARHERKSETYNPADWLKINRVLDPEHFNRFMNLGIQAEHKKAAGA